MLCRLPGSSDFILFPISVPIIIKKRVLRMVRQICNLMGGKKDVPPVEFMDLVFTSGGIYVPCIYTHTKRELR